MPAEVTGGPITSSTKPRIVTRLLLLPEVCFRPTWIVPIPGTTKPHRLDENLGAVKVKLTPEDLREIDEAASAIDVQGARYPEKLEAMTGR